MKKFCLLCAVIGVVVVAACRHAAVVPDTQYNLEMHARKPAESYYPPLPGDNFPDPQRITFKKLLADVRNGKIADTLEQLKKDYPEYLKYYSLMYDSGSAQGASMLRPRAIVYGPEAKFIFSFNGHVAQAGGNVMETMAFDEDRKTFELREIKFKNERPGEKGMPGVYDEIDFETDQVIVSKPNPYACMECHGVSSTGPIWDSYFIWPGAYGSNDDLMFESPRADNDHSDHGGLEYLNKLTYPRSQGHDINLKPGVVDTEAEGYRVYTDGRENHPRYKWLPPIPEAFHMKPPKVAYEPNIFLSTKFGILQGKQLLQTAQRLNLKSKWADIKWPPIVYDVTKDVSLPDFNILTYARAAKKAFGSQRTAMLEAKLGPLEDFIAKALTDEFAYTAGKVKRLEKTFGLSSFRPTTEPREARFGVFEIEKSIFTKASYTSILNRPLNDEEQLAFELEDGDLAIIAVVAYLFRGEGVFLEEYSMVRDPDTNQRILTFEDGNEYGWRSVMEYLGWKFF